MSRNSHGGPKLPRTLLDQVQDGRVSKNGRKQFSRKEQRKFDRQKSNAGPATTKRAHGELRGRSGVVVERDTDKISDDEQRGPVVKTKPILNLSRVEGRREAVKPPPKHVQARSPSVSDDDDHVEDDASPKASKISKTVQARLAEEDAEIAALERKLGIKKKSKTDNDDGLDWLMDELDGEGEDDDEDSSSRKRRRQEYDAWLRNKRSKVNNVSAAKSYSGSDETESIDFSVEGEDDSGLSVSEEDEDESEDKIGNDDMSEDEDVSGEEFEGFDEEKANEARSISRERENPYMAPVAKSDLSSSTKYIPPSLRQLASSDDEVAKQLRRQIQGLLNRLSEANILSILGSIEQIYAKNARQYVTSVLIDLLDGLICDPAALSDTFIILHAGFAAAVYRVIGTDFGAQLLEVFVQSFDKFYNSTTGQEGSGKQMLNLIALVSNMYLFQAVGCEIVFDYMRLLLNNFSENNTELLLRMIRISGTQLRQDNPSALRDAVLLLQRAITQSGGEDKLSVRTKVMVESIQNLKNNRVKTGISASTLATEHTHRMRRTLGSLNNRQSKTTEPLRITLADIRDSEKKGKWWLVGASYRDPAKMAGNQASSHDTLTEKSEGAGTRTDENSIDGDDSDNELNSDQSKLVALARAEGMNTDIRRAIFVSIMGAVDFMHARHQLDKLNLKSKQQLEIPRVILHCVGAEPVYNHFYTLVAMQFCSDHRFRRAFEVAMLDLFRRMGENDGEGENDDDHYATMSSALTELSVPAIYNLAKMFAAMLAKDYLRLTVLKTLDWQDLQSKTRIFVEVLLVEFITGLYKESRTKSAGNAKSSVVAGSVDEAFESAVSEAFAFTHVLPDLCAGLRFYISTTLERTEITKTKKEKRIMARACEIAVATLAEPSRRSRHAAPTRVDDEDYEDMSA